MGNCLSEESGEPDVHEERIQEDEQERERRTKRATTNNRRAAVATGQEDFPEELVEIDKSTETTEFLIKALHDATFFETMDELTLVDLVKQMFPKPMTAGEKVIVQGDEGDTLYIVESGECKAYLRHSGDKVAAEYTRGKLFGELAVLYNSPRAATIMCTKAGKLWGLSRGAFRSTVHKLNVDNNDAFLKKVEIFKALSDLQRAQLARSMEIKTFNDGEYIVRMGEVADALYFIKAGEVAVHMTDPTADGSQERLRLKAGQFFGENAIHNTQMRNTGERQSSDSVTEDSKRSANVVAVGRVIVLSLSAVNFHALIGKLSASVERSFCRKVLDSIDLFDPLTDKQKDEFMAKLKEVRFSKGDDIIKEGSVGDTFYIVKAGQVSVLNVGKGAMGGDKEVAKLGPSDFFGERSLLKNEKTIATVSSKVFSQSLGQLRAIIERMHEEVLRRDELNTRQKITMDQLEMKRTLGVGTFGRVKLVRDTKTNTPYALKILDKRQIVHMKQEAHIMQEKNLLALCHHPFIIGLAATFQDADKLYMVMEICLGGELFSRLQTTGPMPNDDGRFYAACVVSAFSYMHQRRIAYRDLKPENLLLDAKGYIKVVDFGFAKQVFDRTLTLCGTPEYLAPEIILNKSHDIGVDWWTVGILMYEMLSGHPPFADPDPMVLYQKIIRGKIRFPSRFSKEAKDLMSKLIEVNPAIRIGASTNGQEVKDHPWFSGLDWDALEQRKLKTPYVPTIKDPFDDSNFDKYDESDADKRQYRNVKVPAGAFDTF